MPTRGISKLFHEFICQHLMIPTSGLRQLYYGNICTKAVFRDFTKKSEASSGISKLFYKFLYLQMALDNSTMKSYNSNLHWTILLRNMIPTTVFQSFTIAINC